MSHLNAVGLLLQEQAADADADADVIPIIDLTLPESTNAGIIREKVSKVGFFYLEGHGLDPATIENCFSAMRAFFSLPQHAKAQQHGCDGRRWEEGPRDKWGGYLAPGLSTLDPHNQTKPDQKESWSMTREYPSSHPQCKQWPGLQGPNSWPNPSLLPQFQGDVKRYFEAVSLLGPRVMSLVALAFDLRADFFAAPGRFDEPLLTLGANHYSETESQPEQGVLGIGAHTDYGALTFLATDEVPGLQISPPGLHGTQADAIGLRAEGSVSQHWVDVAPRSGALIVNIGDMLERWTNGRLPSTLHRVANRSGKERYSLAFFFEPNADCTIEPISTCGPSLYEKVGRYGDWLEAKFVATGGG